MPNLAKKRTNRRTHFFLPKSAIFLVKSAHFLTPQTIFIAFLCINFFQISNFALFFLFSIAFFYIFLNKGLFCCFIKAHKNFSRRHQPFKGAPMCAKAHMFRNSEMSIEPKLSIHFKELMKIWLTRKQQHHGGLEFLLKCFKNYE